MKTVISTLALALTLFAAPALEAQKPVEGKFLHHVYFWLAQPESIAARKQFLSELNKMRAIPGIRYSFIGAPAADERDVVDNSFTYYWLVTFDDKKAWKIYDTHPLHDAFRQKSALWKKVVVYDTLRVD